MIVTSGMVVNVDLLDCNISNGDVVINIQWIVVVSFCHGGDEHGEEIENGGQHLVG